MLFLRVLALLLAAQTAAWAGDDAKVALGRKLLADIGCNGACHRRSAADGDPLSLYTRPNRKIASFSQLQSQVGHCAAGAGAAVSSDDIDAIAAALNQDFYKFQR